ncbi:MAG: hypothetical protein M4D80_16830 [Myxococcota bacterium]|nr:hypothetical protein [Myxococcota bacterium]
MRTRLWIAGVITALVGVAALPGHAPATTQTPRCEASKPAIRYPVVEPVFVRKCAACHDARKATNAAAQRVFEMSSYPFATERPKTLLHDLREMFATRGGLTDAERCAGFGWIDGGGLDATGKQPSWRR